MARISSKPQSLGALRGLFFFVDPKLVFLIFSFAGHQRKATKSKRDTTLHRLGIWGRPSRLGSSSTNPLSGGLHGPEGPEGPEGGTFRVSPLNMDSFCSRGRLGGRLWHPRRHRTSFPDPVLHPRGRGEGLQVAGARSRNSMIFYVDLTLSRARKVDAVVWFTA